METGVSLAHSQQSANCPYPPPGQSSPCTHSTSWEIHFNIILPSTTKSSKCSLFLRFHQKIPLCIYVLPHRFHMPSPSHSFLFHHTNRIWWTVQIIKLLIMYFSPPLCSLVLLRPKYLPQNPILAHPQSVSPTIWETKFHTHTKNGQSYNSVCFNPHTFGWQLEDNDVS